MRKHELSVDRGVRWLASRVTMTLSHKLRPAALAAGAFDNKQKSTWKVSPIGSLLTHLSQSPPVTSAPWGGLDIAQPFALP